MSDLSRAEKNGVKICGGHMDGGFEKFFHSDGGTTAMDISRKGKKLFG